MESEFTYQNSVLLHGKITKTIEKKDGVVFVLSCGKSNTHSRKKIKMDKKGRYLREVVSVRYFDDLADKYKKEFHVGDFVSASGIVQNVKDHYNRKDSLAIWGLTMFPCKAGDDTDQVFLQGITDSAVVISDNYILLNLRTAVEKKILNVKENAEHPLIEDTFRSISPVGIRCHGDANEQIKRFTKGTWIRVDAFVYGRIIKKKGEDIKVQRIIANSSNAEVIGQVQRIMR